MTNHEERIRKIIKLDLKPQCKTAYLKLHKTDLKLPLYLLKEL